MSRINWELEEAVALFDTYFKAGATLNIENETLVDLSGKYKKRATEKGLAVDEKFRNLNGLKMQIGCIHYVVTEGREGFSNASRLFYKTYELFRSEPEKFHAIAEDFYRKYN